MTSKTCKICNDIMSSSSLIRPKVTLFNRAIVRIRMNSLLNMCQKVKEDSNKMHRLESLIALTISEMRACVTYDISQKDMDGVVDNIVLVSYILKKMDFDDITNLINKVIVMMTLPSLVMKKRLLMHVDIGTLNILPFDCLNNIAKFI